MRHVHVPLAQAAPRFSVRLTFLTAAFILLLGGCTAGRVTTVPDAAYDSPQAALQAITARSPVPALTATARIEVVSASERYPFKAALMMKQPAFLRLESIPLLGPPDFFLTLNGSELRAFLPGKGLFYTGRASAWTLSRFIHLALPPAEIVSLLMGQLPADSGGANALSVWKGEREEGFYRIDRYRAGRIVRSLWIDPDGDHLIRIRVFAEDDTPPYVAEFSEHARVGEASIPRRLKITSEGLSFSLAYTELMSQQDEDAAAYVLPVPEGITPTPLQ